MVEYRAAKNAGGAKPQRDSGWIMLPDGSKKAQYRRTTKFIDLIEDKDNLVYRDMRYAGYGIATNPHLAEQIRDLEIENPNHKQNISAVVERAARKAGKWFKADYGTATHAVTQDNDAGYDVFTRTPPDTPAISELTWGPREVLESNWATILKDVAAYVSLVEAYQIAFERVESKIVLDEFRVRGTLDRLMRIGNYRDIPPPENGDDLSVGDVKTGDVSYGVKKMPMQFRVYAGGLLYNDETYERKSHGANTNRAYVIHLPAGEATATLIPLDLSQAWENLKAVHALWEAKDAADINDWKKYGVDGWLAEQIQAAGTIADLDALYDRTRVCWTDEHVAQAKEKKQHVS